MVDIAESLWHPHAYRGGGRISYAGSELYEIYLMTMLFFLTVDIARPSLPEWFSIKPRGIFTMTPVYDRTPPKQPEGAPDDIKSVSP
jgi:hypothetical protein